jgi:diaminopimelate epimerase
MAGVTIHFAKMSGAGNDFVVVDNRDQLIKGDPSAFVRIVSQRRTGVGADGVLLLERSARADFLMKYYNSDGSYGGFCGNGGRCIARYAYINGIAPRDLSFESLGKLYHAEVGEERVRLRMQDPTDEQLNLTIQVNGKPLTVHFLNTGAPHTVVFLDENPTLETKELALLDVISLGRQIRFHEKFQHAGTNVNFVALDTDGTLHLRTYERGVEEETLACGTGSVASALIAQRVKGLGSPRRILPRSGNHLIVEFHLTTAGFSNVYLEGNADVVFLGELKYNDKLGQLMFLH